MTEIIHISLENEMDLVLAHKRTMKVAEKLGLTQATQTTFATAVSEITRTVIEHTNNANLMIGLEQTKGRYILIAKVTFDSEVHFTVADEGFYYAQKLVPAFELSNLPDGSNIIVMKIGLPRSLKLDSVKINLLKEFFWNEPPMSAYEDIKRRHMYLHKIAGEQEEELRRSRIIDEKKNEFISIASHEIKTPMTVLKAYTQMAKMTKDPLTLNLRNLLDKIDIQATKLNSLVQQLLDVSRIENGNLQYHMKECDLDEFLQEQVEVMRHILPYHTIVKSPGVKQSVLIDNLRMEQVLSNILGNAAKYSERDTTIRINTTINEEQLIVVAISDSGRGMSPDTIRSIFDKFYRAKDVVKTHTGLGMGLYISSKIINDHSGKIWVESKEGLGSTFFFSLPVSTQAS